MCRSKEQFQASRKVCFVPEKTVVLIESSSDFSKKERRRSWYSEEEMQKIHYRCIKDAQRLESGDAKERRPCSRGLEALTTEGKEKAAIFACVDAVIDEQETQWSNDCDDHDRLAVVSQEVSKHSTDKAIKRANKDAKVARKIHRLHQQELSRPMGLPVQNKVQEDSTVEGPSNIGQTGQSKKDSMDVDLGTSYCTTQKDIVGLGGRMAGHCVHKISSLISSTRRAKAA